MEFGPRLFQRGNNKNRNGGEGPDTGGPLEQANEQLATSGTAKTRSDSAESLDRQPLTAFLPSGCPVPSMGSWGTGKGSGSKGSALPAPPTVALPSSLEGQGLLGLAGLPRRAIAARAPRAGTGQGLLRARRENGRRQEEGRFRRRCASETRFARNEGVTLTRHGPPPKSLPA